MFVVVQHPFADLRPFSVGARSRLVERPTWPLARPMIDFVRSSGSVRARPRGGVDEWDGEEVFCDASMALRFPDSMAHVQRGPAVLAAGCRYSFRRFYSQGTTARIETGLRLAASVAQTAPLPAAWLEALFAWLSLDVAVGPRGRRAPPVRLIDAGAPLAAHYLRASTQRYKLPLPPLPPVAGWLFQACTPSIVIETDEGDPVALPRHTSPVTVPAAVGRLHHAWMQIGARRVSAWFVQRSGSDDPALRRLRIHLLRLHAEREALGALLAAVMQRKLDITQDVVLSDAIQQHLNGAIRAIERPARFGVEQTEMIDVARGAFETLFPGETTTLATMRLQIGAKVEVFMARARTQAATINNHHYHGEYMSTTITLGAVTVSGDFNIVTAKSIENSFNKATGAANPALGEALKALSQQVADLVKQLPPDKSEAAARDLEALTTEATSKAPRQKWYQLSGEGLVDAGKAVASMAGPIATAVGTVLGLLTL